MQDFNKEVFFILNGIIDKLCSEDLKSNEIHNSESISIDENDPKLETSPNSSGFEDFYAKSPPEKSEEPEYSLKTSTPIHSENDECFDDTIDAAMNKFEGFPTKKKRILKDAFAQTIFLSYGTADSQCQCELIRTSANDDFELMCSSNNEASNHFLGNERRYSNCYGALSQIKTKSHIRLGLSKRSKPRPFQNNCFQ